MKKLLLILSLLIAISVPANAQTFRNGVSLGIDKDSLLFIIGSPFDNWYFTFGAGLQTFMGNEIDVRASYNKLNFNLYAQVGKWIIPDVAVSLRLSYFTVDGQSKYGLQPFINFQEDTPNELGYYPFHAQALAAVGYVTIDWTNLFLGYERGRRSRTHIFTPLGMGISMLYGPQRNTNPRALENHPLGSMRHNFELCYDGGIGVEYYASTELAVNIKASIFGSESTWDWSPYDNARTRFDIMPNITVGARLNMLTHINKTNPYTMRSERSMVYHEFLTVGSPTEIERREREIIKLASERDSLGQLLDQEPLMRAKIMDMYDSVQARLDSIDDVINKGTPHGINVFEDLTDAAWELGIPAVIVYYELDKYKIDYNGRKRLQNFVREISQLDDTLEFFIVGAADSITGSIRHNQWLSERRSEAALNMMVDNFGADPNQFILVPAGGIMDYDPPEYNRMAMVILRTPETEEIVDRWIKRRDRR